MYPNEIYFVVIFVVLFIWLGVLTYLYRKQTKYLINLFPDNGGDILHKLDEVMESVDDFRKRESFFAKNLKEQAINGLGHIQRVQISRYNPYNDTGGAQSFTAVLLDGKANGVMITSLHSRAGTRIYAKMITDGKSDIELSKEEAEVLKRTKGS